MMPLPHALCAPDHRDMLDDETLGARVFDRCVRRGVLLALAVAAGAFGCQPRAAALAPAPHAGSEERSPAAAPLYLVVYRPGASFRPGKRLSEQPLREHFLYVLSLYRQGILKSAGGFADQRGGALVFTADDDAAALAITRADPAVKAAVFEFELRRWQLVDWEGQAASE